jgi:rhamnulokinase
VGTHDTASAVAATPNRDETFAYLSCGTWSLLGTEVKTPIVNEKALSMNFTNEGGGGGVYRLLKNIMGLWLLQELKREWAQEGDSVSWEQLTTLTAQAHQDSAFVSIINPDDSRFLAPGNMSKRVREYCRESAQPIPETQAAVARCILESLALKYRFVLEQLESVTDTKMPRLHVVGGGIQNELLCQWTANACGRTVVAGPVEATALGNIAVQMIAARELRDLKQARELIARSFGMKWYEPQKQPVWQDAFGKLQGLLKR